ncbi:tail tape-measure protein [Erythrobacter phage vB_EliS-L02]|nr:tail tape-measure protein [Erythrobacter phage vB_EliS-L02]
MKFVVDTSQVQKGLRDYRSAVEGIFTSLDKFEAHVKKTMDGVNKAASNRTEINKFKRAIKDIGNVKIDTSSARKLNTLSKALREFRAPSAAQTKNAGDFFRTLGRMPDLSNAYKSVSAVRRLSTAMEGFKAPSQAQAKRLRDFAAAVKRAGPGLKALGQMRGVSGIANELASISIALRNIKVPTAGQAKNLGIFAGSLARLGRARMGDISGMTRTLTAISGFKAPTGAQIKNLSNFVDAIGRMRTPRNANELADALVRIARAANSAAQHTRTLRGGLGGLNGGLRRTGRQARQARVEMMGLQNAFSATFQIGSALRSLFGALTVAELARSFSDAANAGERLKSQMAVISTEAGFANSQLKFVNETANRLGIDSTTAAQGFGRLSVAAYQSGISVMQARDIFTGFGTAMTVLGTTTERQNDVLLAMQQVMNKGYLAAEELNQQLNEHLPGAMGIAAEYAAKLGYTLEDGLKKKVIDAEGVLAYMAETFRERYGPALEEAMKRPDVQMTRLRSNIKTLYQMIGQAGANQGLAELFQEIADSISPEKVEEYAKAWGETLYKALYRVREAFVWVRDNWDDIKGPLATGARLLASYMAITGAFQIGKFFVTPLLNAGSAAMRLAPYLKDLVWSSRALAATNLTSYYASLAQISSPTTVTGVTRLSNAMAVLNGSRAGRGILAVGRGIGGIGRMAKAATPAVTRLAGVIGAGLSLAWASASKAADDSMTSQVQLNYSATEIIYGMWYKATEGIAKFWDWAMTSIAEGISWFFGLFNITMEDIRSVVAHTVIGMTYTFNKGVEAIGKAFIALGGEVYNILSNIAGGLYSLFTGDFTGAYEAGQRLGSNLGKGFSVAFGDFAFGGADYDKFYARVGQGFAGKGGVIDRLNAFGQEGRIQLDARNGFGGSPRPDSDYTMMSDAELAKITGLDRPDQKDEEGAGGSGGAGGKADRVLRRAERDIARLLQSFRDVDPVGTLYFDFVDTLREQSRVLLNDNGYAQFIKNVQAQSADGKVSVQALIDTMRAGGTLNAQTMDILTKQYDRNVEDIINLLVAQQANYERQVQDATIEALDFKYDNVKRVIDAAGDLIPRLRAIGDGMDQMTAFAQTALPTDEFAQFMEELRSGALDAGDASGILADKVLELAGNAPVLDAALRSLNVSAEEYAEAIRTAGRATEFAAKEAERSQRFGGDLLFGLENETALAGLPDQLADRYGMLQTAVEDYLRAGQPNGPLTQGMIDGLEQQIIKQQQLANQLQRNKEFFENNGVRSYLNDIQTAGQAAQELDRNIFQSLEDQLFSLGTTGQFSFQAIFDTIQQGLVRFAAQDITRAFGEMMFSQDELENGNPTMAGHFLGALGHDFKPEQRDPLGTAPGMPMFVQLVHGGIAIDPRTGGFTDGRGNTVTVGGATAANDNFRLGGGGGNGTLGNGPADQAIAETAKATAGSFGDTMTSMMPMIGLAFAGSFKSPIAQVAVMFGTMLMQKMLMGGGGAGGGVGGILAGLFSEGGYSNAPVSSAVVSPAAFRNAPKYASGTANTSGGMPAILHDNEAVVPLSRGRKIPVEMPNGGGGGQAIVNNWNISTPDADSFKKSRQQVVTDMHMVAQRSFARNRG